MQLVDLAIILVHNARERIEYELILVIKIPLASGDVVFSEADSALLEAKRLDSLVGAKTMTIKKDGNDRG